MSSSSGREGPRAGAPATKSRRVEDAQKQGKPGALVASRAALAAAAPEEAANPPTDRVVSLNVGGTIMTTLASTLRSTPSMLAEWLDSDFDGLPRDAEDRPFLDCDPKNFKHLLNYLRGYGLPTNASDLVMLAEDSTRFQMEALQRDVGVKDPAVWMFNEGPGVAPDGLQFSTADTLSLCGDHALSPSQTHTMTFRVDKCDSIAVGLIAFHKAREDQQIYDQRPSVCYRSSGELVRCLGDEPLFSSGASFANGSVVTVRVRYLPEGCTNATLPPLLRGASAAAAATAAQSVVEGGASSSAVAAPATPVAASAAPPPAPPPLPPATLAGFTRASMVSSTTAAPPAPPPSVPARATQQEMQHATSASAAGGDAGTAAPHVPSTRASPGTLSQASPQAAEASVPFFPSPLSLPEVPIGAVVYFFKDEEPLFEARWPVPVPPLQFAVSMQGNSAVTIVEATSAAEYEVRWDGQVVWRSAEEEEEGQTPMETPIALRGAAPAPAPPPPPPPPVLGAPQAGLTALQLPPRSQRE